MRRTLSRVGTVTGTGLHLGVRCTLEFRPAGGRADPRLSLRSHHSGLTAAEMRVPFVVI